MTATDQERDNAYRAIGRYVVEFSRLIFHMRLQVVQRVSRAEPMLVELAIGEAAGRQIAEAFFAICAETKNMNADDAKLAIRLRKDVLDELQQRNDFAHGDWWVGFGRQPDGGAGLPEYWRVKPGRKEPFKREEITVAALDKITDRLHELRQHVAEFGEICFGTHPLILVHGYAELRVRDIFRIRNGAVARVGPLASKRRISYS